MSDKKRLTTKEKLFIEAYLGKAKFNATKAAIQAGYSSRSATEIGYENLRKPHIKARIQISLSESAMTAEEVLKELGETARDIMSVDRIKALTLLAKHHGLLEHTQRSMVMDLNDYDFTTDELKRVARGEDPLEVLASRDS